MTTNMTNNFLQLAVRPCCGIMRNWHNVKNSVINFIGLPCGFSFIIQKLSHICNLI